MKEFKYLLKKIDEAFSSKMTFIKTKNKFNKLHNEFLNFQVQSFEIYNLLFPLERLFL